MNWELISSEIIEPPVSILLPSTFTQILGKLIMLSPKCLTREISIYVQYEDFLYNHFLYERLSNSLSGDHLVFLQNWMEGHIDDAQKVLNMPVIFGEFGVSLKDERFNPEFREKFINTVYDIFLKSSERGGSGGGCLIWQLFPEGTENMDDGYAIVIPKSKVKSKMLTAHNVKQKTSFPSSPWKFPWALEEEKSDDVNSTSNEEL